MNQVNDQLVLERYTILNDPSVLHAISQRSGGVSAAPYQSLNLGSTVGDDPSSVAHNHTQLYEALGITACQVVTARQVHGNRVVQVGTAEGGSAVPECDGLVTDAPGILLLMRFADCAPILMWDPTRRAVAALHAGWLGTIRQVAVAGVEAMQRAFGSQPHDLRALIGPSIGPCCLELGPEVIAQIEHELPEPDELVSRRQPNGHAWFDLWLANRRQLERCGVRAIELAGVCTCCHQALYYSHRGSGRKTGRFAALVGLR